ncbi:MAG TPA: efflux RND transporter periplasmic adaptor subunit [Candidatus Acidoferrales bacterium]|nr:efflux RND transporter periplasmic adaptor subunit [Candidatus Acidoferrales bacterium]
MNRTNRTILSVSFVIAVAGGGMAGCSSSKPVASASPETVSGVAVVAAQRTMVPDRLEAVGTVRAAQTSQIASQTMGNIVEVSAKEGDRVESGQVLAMIDDSQPRAVVEQASAAVTAAQKEVSSAESEFALTESTMKRYQQLYEKKSISPQEFDEFKTRYQSAEARRDMAQAGEAQSNAALTQARTALSYTRVRAPFAGVVTEKKADIGTLASPGMQLFTLEDARRYRLEAAVDENDMRLVHVGGTVSVFLDAFGGAEIAGKIAQIVPAADPASRSFLVKIDLPAEARLRSGLFGRVRFARGGRPALFIPETAIVARGQLRGVFALDQNQIAQLRYVTLGEPSGQQVEVLSGLQDGEKLVAAPGDRELGGKQIAPRP